MAKDMQDTVRQKMKDGWIRSQMFMEVLAVNEQAAKEALERHIEKMKNESGIVLSKIDWKDVKKVEKPLPNVPEGYSYIAELEVLTETYEKLIYITMNYGPSSIEILEPEEIKLKAWEGDGIANSISDILHTFAARGGGGIVLRKA